MPRYLTHDQRKRLESSIGSSLPFCSGVIPVKPNDLGIFYRKEDISHWLKLHHCPNDSLEHLANTCEPACFGRNKENIYDESYRKAGKLSSDFFRPMLDVKEDKVIRAELYNLNVYGEGSFFKAHVDTPRSESMFGSLVIFFPTAHEGGSLLMRKNGVEWSFDSSKVLADDGGPRLGYVALYSDVEHEVAVVTSGHRITITYNLYFDNPELSLISQNHCLPCWP
ncbi:hypothetical protein F5887DRAFT_1277540 [Amanita rubescens]|nr:hypothetical protein F5887DRAFT_1277540 [Amanita rubescens]